MEYGVGQIIILGKTQFNIDGSMAKETSDWFEKHIGHKGKIIKVYNVDFYKYKIQFDDGFVNDFNEKEFYSNLNRRIMN